MMQIGVIGASECSSEVAKLAEEVGERIAKAGAILICGGLGGVMEAASRGAKMAGGTTIGVLPGTSRREANPYIDIPIPTGMSHARNVIVARSSDAIIAIEGRYGTLSEIAFALILKVPVVGINTWRPKKEGKEIEEIVEATTAREAVEKALKLARGR